MGIIGSMTADAFFPGQAVVKLQRYGTNTTYTTTTKVANYSESGGGRPVSQDIYFGNAFVTIKKPQELMEVSFDVNVNDVFWASVLSGSYNLVGSGTTKGASMVMSGGVQSKFKMKLEFRDETGSQGYKVLYYNALGATYEKSAASDEYLKGKISFSLSAADSSANSQIMEIECNDLTVPALGSGVTGSYGGWEVAWDTKHGYSPGSMLY